MKTIPAQLAGWLLASLSVLPTLGCTAEQAVPNPDLVAVRYAQTQCADRWGQAPGTQQLVAAAQAYLAQQGITLHQPQASVKNAAMVCNACSCTTGVVLEGTVQTADLHAVLALGFTR